MKQKNLVLMVVAVGCGLVAAFLTSQMSAKPPAVERIDVIVASKDLAVGTSYSKDDLSKVLKRKSVAKDAVPPGVIEAEEELLEKRLTRNIRAEEMINKADLTKGVVVSIPPGMSMVSLPINLQNAVHGFVLPGSKVDVLASIQLGTKVRVMPILVNMLVLAVDASIAPPEKGVGVQSVSTVSFAVNGKQALLIQLARARHCEMTLLLRRQDDAKSEQEEGYNIDEVVKLLQNGEIKEAGRGDDPDNKPKEPEMPKEPMSAPTPKTEVVKVPAAKVDIAAGTQITKDLIAEKFELKELPKDLAADAVTNLEDLADDKQVLRTGLGKGQWVTKSLVGGAQPKAPPKDEALLPKPGPNEKTITEKATKEVAIHTANGTKVYRYEETTPGQWKLMPEKPADPVAPKTPEKVD
jgi:Flp pilus assembly protein CpaB